MGHTLDHFHVTPQDRLIWRKGEFQAVLKRISSLPHGERVVKSSGHRLNPGPFTDRPGGGFAAKISI
jgi:hypothetical protein